MITKEIKIGDNTYTVKANALLPRKYRAEFGKDLISELNKFVDDLKKGDNADWSIAENLTWLMIKTAGVDDIGTVEEWLESLDDAFAVPTAFGEVLSLWSKSQETTSVPRKK